MKGLLLKDFYMAQKYCRAFLLIVVVFLLVSFTGDENIFFIVYPSMIAGIIPMSLISYDERDKWTEYSGALPYSRGELVSSKYLIGLIFGGSAYLVSMAATVVRMLCKGYFSWAELLVTGTILFVLGLLGPTILLPFVFKYGAEKGRIVFYAMIALCCALGAILAGLGVQMTFTVKGMWLLGVVVLISVICYFISWTLSVSFYRKREL